MRLKFIGTNGSLGLKHGETYKIELKTGETYILAYIYNGTNIIPCPYSSPQTFAANWERAN